jgi:hypothetical protein
MADAFLAAIVRWIAKHADAEMELTLPTGRVSNSELARVIAAPFKLNTTK